MPSCENCNYQWSWLDTAKIGFKNNKICPNCGERQYVSQKAGYKFYAIYFLLLMVLVFSRTLFDLSNIFYIPLGVLLIIGTFFFIPYSIKLSNEQKPLW
ncbi:hypothetical protein ON064_10130 [Planococcus sp. A6]|uniref:TIGR04104 family putative zinc finger protein n=1 Tax=Planococcus sp. A6 TaxID=2992760 RepID=UPI00237BFAD6|nr:TIGR04104 family putative zinc finger protein [Planococcus sp. A6]MDE0583390.1 hypothetical protein [Planococcus sp. A6]